MTGLRLTLLSCLAVLALAGCAGGPRPSLYARPETAKVTSVSQDLIDLPTASQPVAVAVYGFVDQTGQFSPTENIQTLSRALSQGATSVLIQALREAGGGKWFVVLEREHLDNLLKERQVITEMRQRYLGEKSVNPETLPSLLFAGVLLEGGVIGYDANTLTGGAGARLLGIGGDASYRQDTITVYLRAVATKTGEVLASVVARKTVVSAGMQGGAFRYVSYKNLLETEAGFTVNEPRTIALEQAVQKAAYDLVIEGAKQGVWSFADKTAAAGLIDNYLAKQGGQRPTPAAKPVAVAAQDRSAPAAPAPLAPAPPEALRAFEPVVAPPAPVAAPPAVAAASRAAEPVVLPVSALLRPRQPLPAPAEPVIAVAARPAAPRPVQVAAPVPAGPPAAGGASVQIGAYGSMALVEQGWRETFAGLQPWMAGKSRRVEPVTRPDGTLYRTFVVGFAGRAQAQAFCEALKAKGRDCLVKAEPAGPTVFNQASAAPRPVAASSNSPRARQAVGGDPGPGPRPFGPDLKSISARSPDTGRFAQTIKEGV